MARKERATPAQKQRNQLANAVRERGESPYNLWVVRPPFEAENLILSSDRALELFYWLEGNPELVELDYSPLRSPSAVRPWREALHFADVGTTDARWLSVYLDRGYLAGLDVDGRPGQLNVDNRHFVGTQALNADAQRISNWRRIVPCIRRIQTHPTRTIQVRITQHLGSDGTHSIRSVLNALSDTNEALVLGAIGTLLRVRRITSDCDVRPWSLNTMLSGCRS